MVGEVPRIGVSRHPSWHKLPEDHDLAKEFYQTQHFANVTVFDPFMGSGTTIGEAHKLGLTAIGRDINPVAVEAVRTALGPMDKDSLKRAFRALSQGVGEQIRDLYRSKDSKGLPCDVLYFFWVMQAPCLQCHTSVDFFLDVHFATRSSVLIDLDYSGSLWERVSSRTKITLGPQEHGCSPCRCLSRRLSV